MNIQTFNDKLVLTPYQSSGLTHEVKSGFSVVSQKKSIVGLSLLVEAHLSNGDVLPKGCTVYFDEELLLNPNSGAKNLKKSDFAINDFIVLDFKQAIAVDLARK